MQPWLVVERVIADLVPSISNRRDRFSIFIQHRILTDHKNSDRQITVLQELQNTGNRVRQVARKALSRLNTLSFQVGPFVVEVQRYICERFFAHAGSAFNSPLARHVESRCKNSQPLPLGKCEPQTGDRHFASQPTAHSSKPLPRRSLYPSTEHRPF